MARKRWGRKKADKMPTDKAKEMTGPTTVVPPSRAAALATADKGPAPAVEPEPTPKSVPSPELASELARESAKALREKLDSTPPPKPVPLPKAIMVKPPVIVKQVEHYADPKLKRYPIDTPGQIDNAYGLVTSETSTDRALWGRGYMNKMADVIKARAREIRLVRTWAPR